MKATGIIAELNPLHNGHEYLFKRARAELSSDAIVVIMSGNFVQRGSFALCDKYSRARAAVLSGADLVIELPAVFAASGASGFAKGGVRILKGLGVVSNIAFGSESGDSALLKKTAELLAFESGAFSKKVAENSSLGLSYSASYAKAAAGLYKDAASLFTPGHSNDLLALEYLKENLREGAGLDFFALKRKGSLHDGPKAIDCFASASYIREALAKGEAKEPALGQERSGNFINADMKNIKSYLPEASFQSIEKKGFLGKAAEKLYFDIARFFVITQKDRLSEVPAATEGLQNRIYRAALKAGSMEELIALAKTKRFTYARISRALLQLLLGMSKEKYRETEKASLCYARVLAFNKKGAELLSEIKKKSGIPVYTNLNKRTAKSSPAAALIETDLRASALYAVLSGERLYDASDFVRGPEIL